MQWKYWELICIRNACSRAGKKSAANKLQTSEPASLTLIHVSCDDSGDIKTFFMMNETHLTPAAMGKSSRLSRFDFLLVLFRFFLSVSRAHPPPPQLFFTLLSRCKCKHTTNSPKLYRMCMLWVCLSSSFQAQKQFNSFSLLSPFAVEGAQRARSRKIKVFHSALHEMIKKSSTGFSLECQAVYTEQEHRQLLRLNVNSIQPI